MWYKNENMQKEEKPLKKKVLMLFLLSFQNAEAACGAQKLLESVFPVFKI